MADGLKQRLIGALLVLLVILTAAIILVNNANDNVEEQSQLVLPETGSTLETVDENVIIDDQEALLDPHKLGGDVVAVAKNKTLEKPVVVEPPVKSLPKPAEPKKVTEKLVNIKTVEAVKTPPVVKAVEKPVQASKAKVVKSSQNKWVIQLASFGVKENAQALQKKVKTLGYDSTIQVIKNSQGKTIYRVRIGPESDKQAVDNLVSKVKQHLKLNPQVIKL